MPVNKAKQITDDEPLEIEVFDEDKSEEVGDIVSPFDPKDIKIIVEPKTIDHLVQRMKFGEIDLNTEFQRKGNLWKSDAQSRLIESLLLRFPLPAFYFDAEDDNKWLVVDGLQRLWTIKNFVVNAVVEDSESPPLELDGLDILTDYNSKKMTFNDFNRTMQRRILETPITTYLIQPGTPKEVKYNVFRRINTGGLGLNSMEIRNALNQGKPAKFLQELSDDPELKKLLKIQDKRMEDRELYLRAIAYINKPYSSYETPLSSFLDKSMEEINKKSNLELIIIREGIIEAIKMQYSLFGRDIFSRSIYPNNKLKLNSTLFEVWVSEIFKLLPSEKEILLRNKNKLIQEYILLLRTEDFSKAISTSTSGYAAVMLRFEKIKQLIKSNL